MRRRNSVFQFVLCSGFAGVGLMALTLVANTLHLNIWVRFIRGGCYKRAGNFRHDETGADIHPRVPTLQENDSTHTPYMHIDLNRYKSTCTLTHNAPHAYILTYLHACFSFRRMSPGNDAKLIRCVLGPVSLY